MHRLNGPLLSGILLGGPALGVVLGFAAIGPAYDFYKEHHYRPAEFNQLAAPGSAALAIAGTASANATPIVYAYDETPQAPVARRSLEGRVPVANEQRGDAEIDVDRVTPGFVPATHSEGMGQTNGGDMAAEPLPEGNGEPLADPA